MKGRSKSTKIIVTEDHQAETNNQSPHQLKEQEINLEILKRTDKAFLETNPNNPPDNINQSYENIKSLGYRNRSVTAKAINQLIQLPDKGPKITLDTKKILSQKGFKPKYNRRFSEVVHSALRSPGSCSLKLDVSQSSNSNDKKDKDKKEEYCDICFQDIKKKFSLSCGDFFCKECITQHVLNCMSNVTSFRNLRCPKTICNEKIKDVFVEKLVCQPEYERYLKIKQKIEGLYNELNFPCPIPNCDSFGARADIKNANLECMKMHSFCVKCLKESHRGKNCSLEPDESERLLKDDRLVKLCPNCHSWVEKYNPTGCNNVTCANIWCSLTFCWVCMNPFEKNHYNNPLSICFGMQEVKTDSHFAKHKCLRVFKCMLIFLLIVFVVLPIVIMLFSMVVFTFYILTFVLDGSAVKNLKLKTERRQKVFRFLIYATYVVISLPSLPLGYWTLATLFVSSPFLYIYKRCSSRKDDDEPVPG